MATDVADFSAYQTLMEEVLVWLLAAGDHLDTAAAIATDLPAVKEQFHQHEVPAKCWLDGRVFGVGRFFIYRPQKLVPIVDFTRWSVGSRAEGALEPRSPRSTTVLS